MEEFDEEVQSLSGCQECYDAAYHTPQVSFMLACENPHLLLWVFADKWGYWPAKGISVQNGLIFILFFGDHTVGHKDPHNCFLLTNTRPVESAGYDIEYKNAINVRA